MDSTITLQELTTKTVEAMRPYHGKPEWERLANYVKQGSGGLTLANYLNEPDVSEEKKRDMLNSILRIVENGAWDELPKVARGQAQDGPTPPAAAPKKAAAVPAAPPLVRQAAPAPAVIAAPAAASVLATRESVLPETQQVGEPELPPLNDPLLGAIFTGLLPHFLARIPKPVPAPAAVPAVAPAIDPAVLRRAVRAELANNLEALVKALRAAEPAE